MSETEDYRKFLLLNLIETFWPLETPEEEREFQRLMQKASFRGTLVRNTDGS